MIILSLVSVHTSDRAQPVKYYEDVSDIGHIVRRLHSYLSLSSASQVLCRHKWQWNINNITLIIVHRLCSYMGQSSCSTFYTCGSTASLQIWTISIEMSPGRWYSTAPLSNNTVSAFQNSYKLLSFTLEDLWRN